MCRFFGAAALYGPLDHCIFVIAAGRLGSLRLGAAGLAAGFFFRLLVLESLLAGFEPGLGYFGALVIVLLFGDLGFGRAIILHQGNIAGASIRAAAAFDTVEQIVRFKFFEFLAPGKPIQLLR